MSSLKQSRALCRRCGSRERQEGPIRKNRYCPPCQASLHTRERQIPVANIGSGILSELEIRVFAIAYLKSSGVAEELGISDTKAKNVLNNIRAKFAARTITEALLIGMDEGYEVIRDV